MYYISHKKINRYIGKFLVSAFRKSIEGCGFGYGKGLTGTRLSERYISLPIDSNSEPNWKFMEDYIKQEQKKISDRVLNFYRKKLNKINGKLKVLEPANNSDILIDKKWEVLNFKHVFYDIKRGKRLTKANQIDGDTPYISSSAINNGVDNFISNSAKVRKSKNSLSLANSGSVGACFYQPYEHVVSDHATSLKLKNTEESVNLFVATLVKRLEEKYSFNREINDKRIQREKFVLPVKNKITPDYDYMGWYVLTEQKRQIDMIVKYLKEKY